MNINAAENDYLVLDDSKNDTRQNDLKGDLKGRIIAVIFQPESQAESTCRKIGRISFASLGVLLSYGTLIPSILTANAFNPFPGASVISSAAVVVNFGTFGAANYIDLSHILFKKGSSGSKKCFSSGKAIRIILSSLSGIVSRFPGAGITLKVAPGIASEFRVPLAILSVLGTCSPEIVSMYNTLDVDSLCKACSPVLEETVQAEVIKENLLRCLRGAKQRLLQLTEDERTELFTTLSQAFIDIKKESSDEVSIQNVYQAIMTKENLKKALSIEKVHRSRKWVKVLAGTATSLGTCCALFQNVLFTKLAIDYFYPPNAVWKWGVSSACALTIAHTSFKVSFVSAYQWLDSASGLWGNKQNKKFSETFYPKTDLLLTAFAMFWSFALYGILYESAKSTVDISTPLGISFFAGNFFASFFLIYFVMQNIGERAISAFAQSRWAHPEDQKAATIVRKIEELEQEIQETAPKEIVECLNEMSQSYTFTHSQSEGMTQYGALNSAKVFLKG